MNPIPEDTLPFWQAFQAARAEDVTSRFYELCIFDDNEESANHLAELVLFLLLWGSLGYYVFLHLAYGKLYVSVDPWVDWYPFIPSGQWVIDQGYGETMKGHLIGSTTLWHLRGVWLAVAAPVWLLSWASTSWSFGLVKGMFPQRRPEGVL